MTTLAAPSVNQARSTLANSFTRGTDSTIVLADGSLFPSPTPLGHVVYLHNVAETKFCLLIYTSKAANTLTMGGGATDYALAKNVSVGDEAHEFPIGTIVDLVCAADEIAQLFTDAAASIHDNVAGEIVAVTEKTVPLESDEILMEDSADSDNKKSAKFGNLRPALGLATIGLKTYYIDEVSGSDSNGGEADDDAFATWAKAESLIPIFTQDMIIINIIGDLNEAIDLRVRTLGATLRIRGSTATPADHVIPSIRLESIFGDVRITDLQIEGPFLVFGCGGSNQSAQVSTCNPRNSGGRGIDVQGGSLNVSTCDFGTGVCTDCIFAAFAPIVVSKGNSGTGTQYGLNSIYGSTIVKYDATQPGGSTAAENTEYGGVIR